MSIPVSPAELPEVLARFGSASLISHAAPHVKVHTVDPVVEGEDLVVEPVRESLRANLAADPHVTLVWQPLVRHGWTLIVDGVGRIDGDRLWGSLMDLAQIGATKKGGVCRLALTELDGKGRDLVVGWARMAGLSVTVDQIGNGPLGIAVLGDHGAEHPNRVDTFLGVFLNRPRGNSDTA